MRKRREATESRKQTKRASMSRHGRAAILLLATTAWLAFAASASATPPTAPFNQCPGFASDTSCADLIVINAQGGLESYPDATQLSYDGEGDELIGVLNDSTSPVTSISLHGNNIFGFDGKGLCSGNFTGPAGCPFGTTGYEGPNTSFSEYKEEDLEENADTGTVNFLEGTVQPGQSAYFTLAGRPEINCHETQCESTAVSTELSGDAQSGADITVPEGTAVSDKVTLSGPNASVASGFVDYKVYRDSGCTELEAENEVPVTNGSATVGPETFSPGTYYWTMSYTGDSHNAGSQSACGSEVETVTAVTGLSTSLSGGGHSGATINVLNETAVTDHATLSGANASTAGGTVSYKVYSDSECKHLVANAGEVSVTVGAVPASSPETLGLGTYYWQASYSGDAHDGASQTACGSEVETVTAPCSSVVGKGKSASGEPHLALKNNLNTGLTGTEAFQVKYGGKPLRLTQLNSASCVFRGTEKIFSGKGSGKIGKVTGYEVSLSITVAGGNAYITVVVEKGHVVEKELIHVRMSKNKEHIV